jgi:hypothetical protein
MQIVALCHREMPEYNLHAATSSLRSLPAGILGEVASMDRIGDISQQLSIGFLALKFPFFSCQFPDHLN